MRIYNSDASVGAPTEASGMNTNGKEEKRHPIECRRGDEMSPIRVRFSLSGIYYIVNYETLFSAGLLRNTGPPAVSPNPPACDEFRNTRYYNSLLFCCNNFRIARADGRRCCFC